MARCATCFEVHEIQRSSCVVLVKSYMLVGIDQCLASSSFSSVFCYVNCVILVKYSVRSFSNSSRVIPSVRFVMKLRK